MTVARVTREDVIELAMLARVELAPAEIDALVADLGAILDHVGALSAVDTTDVPPMTHAVPMDLRLRADVVAPSLPVEVALAAAPARDGDQFTVPAIISSSSKAEP